MKRLALCLLFAAASASAQDSSFSALRVRGSVLRMPEIGALDEDWRAKTGAQIDVATIVAGGEIALAVGRVGFEARAGKTPFTETLFSLAWTRPVIRRARFGLDAGARLTDVRMDFDDPALVAGLRTEEEQLISALARARLFSRRRISVFVEASYGALMTSTRTPTATIAAGIQHDGSMPGWLRDFLR